MGALIPAGASSTALALLTAGAALAGARAVLAGSRPERERREREQERERERGREQESGSERGGEQGGDRAGELGSSDLVSPALLIQLQLAEALAAARREGAALRDALVAGEAGVAAAEIRAEVAEAAKSRLTLGYAAAAAAKDEELAAAQLNLFEQTERLEAGSLLTSGL